MTINTPAGEVPADGRLSDEDRAYLDRTFTYHSPTGDQAGRYVAIRASARIAAETILLMCPPSRERSLALTNLEQAVMWANASVARTQK